MLFDVKMPEKVVGACLIWNGSYLCLFLLDEAFCMGVLFVYEEE